MSIISRLRDKAAGLRLKAAIALAPVMTRSSGSSWAPIQEHYTGAWQQNAPPLNVDGVVSNNAVFACVTLVASDIGKLRPKLVNLTDDGIWVETTSPAFSPVLRKPNRFQTHIQFKEGWVTSKLLRGNAYALKQRDQRGVVVALYVLDPSNVKPLVAPDGSVYYQLSKDNLSGLTDEGDIVVPASEVIHDRMNCLFHPLVGISPLHSAGATADQGLKMQSNSSTFFANNSSPGGILTAPGVISDELANRLKEHWEKNYSGSNAGRVAVLGDNLHFEPMRMTAQESQLREQVDQSAKVICSSFHVPPFMIGLGEEPSYANGETRTSHYYSQCLQTLIESMEECLDEGLGLLGATKDGKVLGVELDLTGLLRMDTKTQMEALALAVKGSLMATNEARKTLNLPPVVGGDTIYMQQQNYSLEALSNRPPPDSEPTAAPAADAPEAVEPSITDASKALKDELRALLEKHAEEAAALSFKQAETAESVKAIAEGLADEREALEAKAVALTQQQEAYEASKAMAEALIRKFSRVRDAA